MWGLIAAVLLLSSCLNSDDDKVVGYDDTAVTAFTLGTLNRYMHTTSSEGGDSVYTTTFAGSKYAMLIDQVNFRIFNRDSLPYGTDVAHVLCTMSTTNSGVIFFKSITSDSLFYYSSNDSIDFSSPRTVRVFSSDGQQYRDYTVTLNVKQTSATGFAWTETTVSEFDTHRSGNTVFTSHGYSLALTQSGLYSICNGELKVSTDGGATWTTEPLDGDAALLPSAQSGAEPAMTCWDYPQAGNAEYLLLVGKSEGDDSGMSVWHKIARSSDGGYGGRWVCMSEDKDNPYRLPANIKVSLAKVGDGVLAFGSNDTIYLSKDLGITWNATSDYGKPDGASGAVNLYTDNEGTLWLRKAGTGTDRVWKSQKNIAFDTALWKE